MTKSKMTKKHLTRRQLVNRFRTIKLLALDVDGVLTDDRIYFGPDGFEMKQFHISDGLFMVLAMRAGLEVVIVSGRHSDATTTRMKDLGITHVLQQMLDKRKQVAPLLKKLNISHDEVAFVGNEILDIGLAKEVGLSIAVADAAPELIDVVDYVTKARGGTGAVKEVVMAYFTSRGLDPASFLR
ncbi:MAG: HAD-IIIA family hydrolase [candidate division Zixibacteria bacterium]|nr:HAD-IIIA family hydrolase [candidate division Zixibacteria bacterium]